VASVANVAIVQLRHVLGLGSEARMNLPGRTSGNWKCRYLAGALTKDLQSRLKQLTIIYDR